MKILKAIFLLLFLIQCSEDSGSDPVEEVDAPKVIRVSIDDITNNGNATDLEVSFNRVVDESLISEYRVFVVRSSGASAFNLSAAESVSSDNYIALPADGLNKNFTLDETATDAGGDLIVESVSYAAFVLSIADGENATNNSLSSSSNEITLAETTIKITYIGNDGVFISDGEKAVVIDALPGNLNNWITVAGGVQSGIESGTEQFDNAIAAMVTHNHSDHYSTSSVNRFLQRNPNAILLAPPQVVSSGISGGAQQIVDLNLELDTEEEITKDGVSIRVMRIRHFNPQDGTNFASTTESYAFMVELGGKKVLHIGDGDLSSTNFADLGLKNENIDVALIPTFNFSGQLTTANRDILLNNIDPEVIIGLHLASATPVSDVTNLYPNAVVFNQSLQFIRL